MNANDYCSAPPPLFLLRHAPSKAPLCSASDREALHREKQPVLVSIVTSTGKWWRPVLLAEVTSTDPIGDQYWSLLPLPRDTLSQSVRKESQMSESKSARCDRSHSGHSPIEYRRGESYYSALSAAGASAVAFVERRERRVLGAAFLSAFSLSIFSLKSTSSMKQTAALSPRRLPVLRIRV